MTVNASIGTHLIADFCGAKYQTDSHKIEQALISAAKAAGAHVLHTSVHRFPDSNGVTGVVILSESHISVHTWPEYDYMAFDIFMCGDAKPQLALEWLAGFLEPVKITTRTLLRSPDGSTDV